MRIPRSLSLGLGLCAALPVVWLAGCASNPKVTIPAAPEPPNLAASQAADNAATELTEQRFAKWVENFRAYARQQGIDEATLHAALDTVKLRPRAVESDRAQPEFTRPIWDYLEAVVSPQRVANGQQKLKQYQAEADAAEARFGVPTNILVAVWGIESNYGLNYGDIPVVDALATLGFEGRREAWAKGELLDALRILQKGDIDRAHMIGSWAGAMGQTQFMPSSFMRFAVDGDGDGRRDIWGSMADVLASTANFLARSGWQPNEPWGLEVKLPPGFDAMRADASVRQTSAQWAADGVRSMDGSPLPDMQDAAILLPAGVRGPAFLVGRNYRTVLRYNNSMSYALTVCLLAQRIGGGPGVQGAWPRDQKALSRTDILALQEALNRRGFDSGKPDGQVGPATRQALRLYQQSVGVPADGYPTVELLQRLQASNADSAGLDSQSATKVMPATNDK